MTEHLAKYWSKLPFKGKQKLVTSRVARFPTSDPKIIAAAILLHPLFRHLMAQKQGVEKGKVRIPEQIWRTALKVVQKYEATWQQVDRDMKDQVDSTGRAEREVWKKLHPHTAKAPPKISMLVNFPPGENPDLDMKREHFIWLIQTSSWGLSTLTQFRVAHPYILQNVLTEIDEHYNFWPEVIVDLAIPPMEDQLDHAQGELGYTSGDCTRVLKMGYQPTYKKGFIGASTIGGGKLLAISDKLINSLAAYMPPNPNNMAVTVIVGEYKNKSIGNIGRTNVGLRSHIRLVERRGLSNRFGGI